MQSKVRVTWRLTALAALVMLLFGMAAGPGMALAAPLRQGAIPISYGQTLQGTISDQQWRVIYSFQGQAGDVVTIAMNRIDTTLDPYVGLLDASENVLAENDDFQGQRDSFISETTLPATGTYYIVATRYGLQNGTSFGAYNLILTRAGSGTAGQTGGQTSGPVSGGAFGGLPTGDTTGGSTGGQTGVTIGGGQQGGTAQQQPGGLTFECNGQTVNGATLITFRDVRPGFNYQVTVIGLDNFDPVIALQAEDGSTLCNDDEPRAAGSQISLPDIGYVEASSLTSQLSFNTSVATGDLVMAIGGFGSTGGHFVAIFEGLAISPATEQDAVTFNVSGAIQNEPILVYMIAETTSLDSYMFVDGTDIVCDDAGSGPCADTPAFSTDQNNAHGVVIANGGQYIAWQYDAGIRVVPGGTGDLTFVFQSYNGQTQGEYAMVVVGAAPGAGTVPASGGGASAGMPASGSIAYGQTVQGTIDNANPVRLYTFSGQAGDRVTVTMQAAQGSALDPYLGLMDANQNVLIENDDSPAAGGLNSQLEYTLPASGTYTIVATRYGIDQGTSSGAFTLTLQSGAGSTSMSGGQQPASTGGGTVTAEPIAYGQTVQGVIDSNRYGYDYVFSGQAGDVVTITMQAAQGSNLDTTLGLFDSASVDAQPLVTNDDMAPGNYNSQIVYTLPATGQYWIYATRYNGQDGTSTGAFTLSLTVGGAAPASGGKSGDVVDTGK